jgi:hypothetical protein
MTTSARAPGPRDGLDEGSLAELAQGGREVEVQIGLPQLSRPSQQSRQSRTGVASAFGTIDVPDDASALVDGLAAYGS